MYLEKYTNMLKDRLMKCRFSGLTGVRTVSDDLSSSGDFSFASDQTMAITKLDNNFMNLKDLDAMVRASIVDFIPSMPEDLSKYDLVAAAKWQA